MLRNKLINFKFFKFVQSGFYMDFIFKKLSEMFIRNIFIYSSLFFGEKYMIEYLTKKTTTAQGVFLYISFNVQFFVHCINLIAFCAYAAFYC